MCACSLCVPLLATPWTVARQAPLSMGFFRQEYWGGLPFPAAGDLPDPGIEPESLLSPALASTLMAESEEELKGLMMKVKKMSEKLAYSSTFKKLRSEHSVPSLHGK